ncbi:MAG: YaaR family protein [Lutispora sp.]|uniref:YaaR family protein n=1 Tax=Lutispora sp. TaxID=2828727 RepID=UPI00356325B1
MKVRNIEKTNTEHIASRKAKDEASISFREVMSTRRDEMDVERLNRLMEDVDAQGKVLAQSMTVEDLRDYKKKVKEFLSEAVKYGLKIQQNRGFNRGGRMKIYKIVQKVDDKLLELTDAVINKQEKGIKVLSLIGEIRGLLLDVYA